MTNGLIAAEVVILLCGIVLGYDFSRQGSFRQASALVLFVLIMLGTQYELEAALKNELPNLFFHRIGWSADIALFAVGALFGWLWWRYNSRHELGFFWRALWWVDLVIRNLSAMNLGSSHNFEYDATWWGNKYSRKKNH